MCLFTDIVASVVEEAGYIEGAPKDYDREHAVDTAKLTRRGAPNERPPGSEARQSTIALMYRGAPAVQRLTDCTRTNRQIPVAFFSEMPYDVLISGWAVSGSAAFPRPHNPSVPGSSPGCPILGHPPKQPSNWSVCTGISGG